MPGSAANNRPRITSAPALLLMAAGILLVFVLMFPGQKLFHRMDPSQSADAVSVMYLRAEMALHPDDTDIRLLLARQLFSLNRLAEAHQTLEPLCLAQDCISTQVRILALEIDARLWQQLPVDSPQHKARQRQIGAQLRRVATKQDLNSAELQQLATLALQLEQPGLASRFYARLAKQDPVRAIDWWSLAARWELAVGRPEAAARHFQKAYNLAANDTQARQYAWQSLDGMMAAGRESQALELARLYLQRFPQDAPLQQRTINMALNAGQTRQARQWNLVYLRQHPNDRRALQRQRDLELARGNPRAALPWARRLVTLNPGDRRSRETLAQLLEWSGWPVAAQREWERLARSWPRERYDNEVQRLAKLNYDSAALIASLKRREVQHPLTAGELEQLYAALLHEGDNQLALQVLEHRRARNPEQRELWVKLAEAQAEYGDLRDALATWQRIEQRFGGSVQTEQQQLVLYWRLNETAQAWRLAQSAKHLDAISDKYPLQILGELGWRYRDVELARFAYMQLWEKHPPEASVAYRLIIIAEESGDSTTAAHWGLEAWRRTGDRGLLLNAMTVSNRLQDTQTLQALLDAAASAPDSFGDSEIYWLLRAGQADRAGDYQQALYDYQAALRINPASNSTRSRILWTLVNASRPELLQYYLRRFQSLAAADATLWGAYAAALTSLGRAREALPWYVRQLEMHDRDYLWLLNFADVLGQAGRHNSALRIRRYAFNQLRPEAGRLLNAGTGQDPLSLRYTALLRDMAGAPSGENGLRRLVQTQVASPRQQALMDEYLIGWYLSREQLPMARYWLLRSHAKRLTTPRWQALALALADNDLHTVGTLLRQPAGLDLSARVEGLLRLGQADPALALALEGLSGRTPSTTRNALRQQAASLRQELPKFWQLALGREALGDLFIDRRVARFGISRNSWGMEALLGENQLDSDPAQIDLRGASLERHIDTRWTWHLPRARLRLNAGANLRNDADLRQAGLNLQTTPRSGQSFTLAYQYNELTDESRALRALGSRDRLVLAFGSKIGSRESAWLQLYRSLYHDRQRNRLGDGFGLDALVEHRLAVGSNEWAVRIQGSLQNNQTVANLPDDMASRLPTGSDMASVLAGEYRSLGVGLRLNRGAPGEQHPKVGSLRYFFDAWVGQVWPQPRFAFNVDIGVGTRILGSDELSFSARYSETTSFLPQEARSGLWLDYRYFLGR